MQREFDPTEFDRSRQENHKFNTFGDLSIKDGPIEYADRFWKGLTALTWAIIIAAALPFFWMGIRWILLRGWQ